MHGITSGTGSVLAGDAGFVLSAPGANRKGYVDITIASPTWLTFPWHGATASAPTGRATFGIYKTPIIYMRENY
jgi:MSHA biogenesis protein MshQ